MTLAVVSNSACSSRTSVIGLLDKNQEYMGVHLSGYAHHTQNQPNICLKWKIKQTPFHRRG